MKSETSTKLVNEVVLMIATTPAKIPKLIAQATPSFSFLLIFRFHTMVQGRRAKTKSMAPEYAPAEMAKLAAIEGSQQ